MSPLAQGSLPQYDSPTFLNLVTTAASHGTTKLSSAYEPSRGVQLILCCNVIGGLWVSRLSFTGRFHGGVWVQTLKVETLNLSHGRFGREDRLRFRGDLVF